MPVDGDGSWGRHGLKPPAPRKKTRKAVVGPAVRVMTVAPPDAPPLRMGQEHGAPEDGPRVYRVGRGG